MIKLILSREGADRRRDRLEMETFYYSAIYDAIRESTTDEAMTMTLKLLETKIISVLCSTKLTVALLSVHYLCILLFVIFSVISYIDL